VAAANVLEYGETIHGRKEDIEEDDVLLCGKDEVRAFTAVVRKGDTVTVTDEGAFDQACNSLVIFDDENVHGGVTYESSRFSL
jgi:hypothetical protein